MLCSIDQIYLILFFLITSVYLIHILLVNHRDENSDHVKKLKEFIFILSLLRYFRILKARVEERQRMSSGFDWGLI